MPFYVIKNAILPTICVKAAYSSYPVPGFKMHTPHAIVLAQMSNRETLRHPTFPEETPHGRFAMVPLYRPVPVLPNCILLHSLFV